MYNIHYVKVPKTASSSNRVMFVNYCNDHSLKPIVNAARDILDCKNTINASLGHVPFHPKYINHINGIMDKKYETLVIASVRDPLDRFMSNYKHAKVGDVKNFNKFYLNSHLKLHGKIIWQNTVKNNSMAWYLGFHHIDEITEENIMEKFHHVIIFKDYENSIDKLSAKMGCDLVKTHVNRGGSRNPKVTQEVEELFKENNKLDYKLYDLCVKIYG